MRKSFLLTLLGVGLNILPNFAQVKEASLNIGIGPKVKMLLSKMTLEEKVGQMTNLTLDAISKTDAAGKIVEPHQIDEDKLKEKILKYHVGSFQNVAGHTYDRKHWFEIISAMQRVALQDRLKIPALYGIDAIHGVTYTIGSTLFPQEIGMAATFNPKLVQQIGGISAYETRASYIPWNFSPVLDVAKFQTWPRIYETFGEDPFLVKTMGAALIKGYQGNNVGDKYHVTSTMKHFLGYGAPLSGKDRTPAWIPDRYMREYFLPPFIEAVKAGSRTVMINSSEINGVPVHSSKYLLTDVLRKELKFDGIVISDWMDVRYLYTRHHVAASEKEAVGLAVNAGIDMCIVPFDYTFYDYLIQLVHEGKVPMSRINEAVARILQVKYELGLFERPIGSPEDYTKFGSAEFTAVNHQAAAEAITLLKNNNNILPLKKSMKVLVTGPAANTMRSLDGGWSYTWQGDQDDKYAADKNTILEAIQQKIGKNNVAYEKGATFDSLQNVNATLEAAQKADAVILCLGETSYTENVGNIDDLNLPAAQIELAQQLAKTGKPIILVMAEGRPRIITPAESLSSATIMAYFSGNEGGNALADILFGDVNPSGKLPFTYPRNANALVNYYRKNLENGNSDDAHGYNPLYEFGFGLSYTPFRYSNLRLDKANLKDDESVNISVDVTNNGARTGKESVLLFISDLYASIAPDTKRLRGFDKIELKAGETRTVTFKITAKDLAFINDLSKPVTEPGEFKVQIGDQTKNFNYQTTAPFKPAIDGKL
ncbi:glycoside hydrolase family 3 N-terminal domain-containing protein [Mucilaginibacter arboris]|uniref:beta-glucosidase n=1 Tax=Mucilaginibacter arboris TaxID=2682090 RepID=A0A7K1SX37_9SPHI|nr:glycoside hydrolase family 3 N-terminal domain-containing protein [Mucilaginibacter arboris]MVN21872.1 beta-glucosidase [Mucilaginibacter arboris]